MRNAAAILLLLVFLFNFAGYRLFFVYADHQADRSFSAMIDKGRLEPETFTTVSVPLNMPYIAPHGFEPAEGEITLHGQVYKFVSRAVQNDSLVLRCLPDHSRTAIAEAKNNFGAQVTDHQLPGKKIPEAARKFLQDNDYDLSGLEQNSQNCLSAGNSRYSSYEVNLPAGPFLSLLQPPDCLLSA